MKIYGDNGYLDFPYILDHSLNNLFCIGARGIGKSFGALKTVIDRGEIFIYMRRTQTQIDLIKNPDFNPFKALENELGEEYRFILKKVSKYVTGIYKTAENEDGEIIATGAPIGYMLALSVVANIRGWSSDAKWLIYDEFVPEKHERAIKSEGLALLNAMETIGRNRSLKNEKDVLRLIALSNSTMLANPVFIELQMVTLCEKMLKKGDMIRSYPDRDLTLIILDKSPISERKAKTSLYKLAGTDSEFSKMALDNEFTNEEMQDIESRDLREYKPIVNVGELAIYRHKSKREYYVTNHKSGTVKEYETGAMELKRFTRDYYYLWLAYLNRSIVFESYINKVLLEKYFNIW